MMPAGSTAGASLDAIVEYLGAAVRRVVNRRGAAVERLAALASAGPGDLAFCSGTGGEGATAAAAARATIVLCADALLDVQAEWPREVIYVGVDQPRLAFVRVCERFFPTDASPQVHPSAVVGEGCRIDASDTIGAHATIGSGVVIGRGTRIGAGVSIADGTRIGDDCTIHPNAVIGEAGFGFEREVDGRAVPFPHVAHVVIGNRVLVGAASCIARGALSDTVIEDDVQIDSHVHVAHNVHVERGATIVAHASISGSARIGAHAWLAPGSLIMGGVTVGEGATVGVGAVVTKAVAPKTTVFGNPARAVWSRS